MTHDIDFYGLRRHRFDSTFWGFFYRATAGSLLGVVSGRRSFKELWTNLKTVVSLPLVYVGVLPDPWRPFDDYLSIEDDLNPTFFLVPFKDVEALANHSVEILASEELRRRLGQAGRKRAVERFNVARCVADHERLYRDVLRESAARPG